jgi:hypothetical protein
MLNFKQHVSSTFKKKDQVNAASNVAYCPIFTATHVCNPNRRVTKPTGASIITHSASNC